PPAHLLARGLSFIGEVAVAELWVFSVRVEQGIGPVRLGEFGIGDRALEPPVVRLTSYSKYPPAPPRRGCRQRRARSRAGTTFSRQIRLGQVGSSSAQDLVLLLQQPNAALGLAQFLGLGRRGARLDSGFDVGLADPLLQRHGVDTEVGGDLLESHTVFTVLSDADNVVAELLGIGLGHNNILPGRPGRASQIRCHLLVHQPRRSTSPTGGTRSSPTTRGGSTARRPRATRTSPGSSTSSITSHRAERQASCSPTGPCPRRAAVKVRSAASSSRRVWWTASSRCLTSCSSTQASRLRSGSSRRDARATGIE